MDTPDDPWSGRAQEDRGFSIARGEAGHVEGNMVNGGRGEAAIVPRRLDTAVFEAEGESED